MARSDFNWVHVFHTFTVDAPTFSRDFPIEGNQAPIDDAYLLIQVRGVSRNSHRIEINGTELGGMDIPSSENSPLWQLWMDHIPPGALQAGTNTIRITRVGSDNFTVRGVAINWREPG